MSFDKTVVGTCYTHEGNVLRHKGPAPVWATFINSFLCGGIAGLQTGRRPAAGQSRTPASGSSAGSNRIHYNAVNSVMTDLRL